MSFIRLSVACVTAIVAIAVCVQARADKTSDQNQLVEFAESGLQIRTCPEHPDATGDVIKQVVALRVQMLKTARQRDLVTLLSDPEIKKEFAKTMASFLALKGTEVWIEGLYNEELKQLDNKPLLQMVDLKRVYIYERSDFDRRVKAAEPIAFTEFDEKSGQAIRRWSLKEAQKRGGALDFPIFIIFPDKYKNEAEWTKMSLIYDKLVMETTLQANNGRHAFQFITSIARKAISEKLPPLPLWFREGVSHQFGLAIMTMGFGQKEAFEGYNYYIDQPSTINVSREIINLENWNPEKLDAKMNQAYRLASMEAVVRTTKEAGPTYVTRLLERFKKSEKVESKDIYEATHDIFKVKMQKYMPSNPRPVEEKK